MYGANQPQYYFNQQKSIYNAYAKLLYTVQIIMLHMRYLHWILKFTDF